MGKFIVIGLASLFVCGMIIAGFPATGAHAFYLGQVSVRWIYLIGVGCLYGGYKLHGK